MFIKQLSIFVENKTGRLQSIIDTLSKNGVNISALSIADTTDFGILRMIVDDVDKARNELREIGVISKCTDVIAVYIDDTTGGLASVLKVIAEENIGIEYMYAFLGRVHGKAVMVLKAENPEKTAEILKAHNIEIASMD